MPSFGLIVLHSLHIASTSGSRRAGASLHSYGSWLWWCEVKHGVSDLSLSHSNLAWMSTFVGFNWARHREQEGDGSHHLMSGPVAEAKEEKPESFLLHCCNNVSNLNTLHKTINSSDLKKRNKEKTIWVQFPVTFLCHGWHIWTATSQEHHGLIFPKVLRSLLGPRME